eukprot:CAMPEP_0171063456 /NCGR_PEP_ID=MMETSP0766_2-20121228/5666_1 /TAXON_ID=439317 /ORGANISM="Gambierdiscus australes, Strain CAWD 149" /LENGTH=463 /DNA_ID=CAMNT_0011519363 /DNA_START=83 /DNA_END=1474 /DNA_ORIENTATION=-
MSALADRAAQLLAEFVGTFMLVLTVGCNTLSKSPAAWAPTSIACTLMVMIYSFGHVSGGHLNPSVSLAAALARKQPMHVAAAYIIVQIMAGVCASCCFTKLYGAQVPVGPQGSFTWWEVMIVEALYTAMLAFVVLSVTSKRNHPDGNPNQFYALAIGFVVIAGGYAAGPISGACFNPAVSLGLDISSYSAGLGQGFWYLLYQVIGSVIAALLFRVTRPEEYKPEEDIAAYEPKITTRLASEFCGTFMLMLTVGLNVMGKSPAVAWSAAASLMCMIYALGDVSGGHFNPAVTLAVVLSRKGRCSLHDGLAYMAIQAIAGILASFLYAGLYSVETFPLEPKAPYSDGAAYILEFLFTFVLSFVVLSTAVVKGITTPVGRNFYFALAIGSCVTAGGSASGAVSGGSLNPAVSMGIAISHTLNYGRLYYCLTFCLAELFGGLVAAVVFAVTHSREYRAKSDQSLFSG